MNQHSNDNHNIEQQVLPQATPERLRHGGLGITSFVMAASAMLLTVITFICFATVDMIELSESLLADNMSEEQIAELVLSSAPQLIIGVLLFFFTIFVAFVGGIIGIAGLVQKNRKKLFAIIGTIVNWLLVILVVFLTLVGLLLQL